MQQAVACVALVPKTVQALVPVTTRPSRPMREDKEMSDRKTELLTKVCDAVSEHLLKEEISPGKALEIIISILKEEPELWGGTEFDVGLELLDTILEEAFSSRLENVFSNQDQYVPKFLEIGTRVLVRSGDGLTYLGLGTYEGEVPVYVWWDGEALRSQKIAEVPPDPAPDDTKVRRIDKNPKIRLDSGEIVYGCQVWWGPVEVA